MSNLERYIKAFTEAFEVEESEVFSLEYQCIPAWDSVGHMGLIALLEEDFDIMMETDDIIEFSSFEKGKEIMEKYDVVIK